MGSAVIDTCTQCQNVYGDDIWRERERDAMCVRKVFFCTDEIGRGIRLFRIKLVPSHQMSAWVMDTSSLTHCIGCVYSRNGAQQKPNTNFMVNDSIHSLHMFKGTGHVFRVIISVHCNWFILLWNQSENISV